jgi:hypothetical protein
MPAARRWPKESVTLPPDPFAVPVKPQDDLKQRA